MDINIIYVLIIGLIVGYFLNSIIAYLPEKIIKGWDIVAKEHLKMDINESDKVNIKFKLFSKPSKYFHLEILTALLFYLSYSVYGYSYITLFSFIMIPMLLTMSYIDLKYKLLLDNLTLSFLWIGLLFNYFTRFIPLEDAVLGAVSGYMFFWLTFQIHKFIRKIDGMGYGDFKLFAAIGAWLGIWMLPAVLLIAAVTSLFYGIYLKIKKNEDTSPFGQSLSFSCFIVFIYFNQISEFIKTF